MRELTQQRARAGYRMIAEYLRRDGLEVGVNRVHRL